MNLLSKAAHLIGVVIPTYLDLGREILRGVRSFCAEQAATGMNVISETGYHSGVVIPKGAFDCIVVMHSQQQNLERISKACPHLVVTSNRETVSGFARVLNDDEATGCLGAEHLLGLGYRNFAFLSTGGLQFAEEREAGFVKAIEAAGLAVHRVRESNAPEIAVRLQELLKLPGPMAIMAASDLHARWIVESIEDPLSWIPGKLAVLGVDDDSLQNTLSSVSLSTVALSGERIGYEAASLGMRLAKGQAVPVDPIRIAPKLVVNRQSTDALAIKDRVVARTLRVIRERMGELENAADLVKIIGVPRRTLEVKFRKLTGQTLAGELASARGSRARELLSTTDLSVKEIAFLVGFSEPRMLTLVFKRVTGELPSEYRERVQPGG